MEKRCAKCRERKPTGEFNKDGNAVSGYRSRCRTCQRVDSKEYYQSNPDKKSQEWVRYLEKHGDRERHRIKRNRRSLREKVLSFYGGTCQCCGEGRYEFLAIDHVNNDGAAHRKELGSSKRLYQWLVENKFPSGFQVLCHNCNLAKGFYGECPHARESTLRLVS